MLWVSLFGTVSGVVEPPDETPDELEAPGEEFAKVGHHYEAERYPYDGVQDTADPPRIRGRGYVTVSYKTKKKSINVFFSAWLLDLREPDENSDYWLVHREQ